MSESKRTVERYMTGFRLGDHAMVLSCLAEGVVWDMPGFFHLEGKEAFDREIENEAFVGRPTITVSRMVEEDGVVVAEGAVRCAKRDGGMLNAVFCDVFEFGTGGGAGGGGRHITRLVSYLMEIKVGAP
jgi:uncharacterized protein